MKSMISFKNYSHLSFDCYGTLIDWESGILSCLHPILSEHNIRVRDEYILRMYAKYEALEESGAFKTYYNILRNVMSGIGNELGFSPSETELNLLSESVGSWQPFPDTVEFLRNAKERYKLVIISNIDDAIFEKTAELLRVKFDAVITAQQAGSYKPAVNNFLYAIEKLGINNSKLLHIAQSIYHDHVPAKKLGISSIRVNRKSICTDTGIALKAEAAADFEVPDLRSLTALMNEY
jgi:2-haloacid dehalogenase